MIFRNTVRLLLTNFSNVWKALLYYIICVVITLGVCWGIASPIIDKLAEAKVFENLIALLNSFFSEPQGVVYSFNEIIDTAWNVIVSNIQFRFNYIFLIVWVVFVFPFMLDLAQLTLGEVLYGFMTSQVKYGYTGRFIKNIGKSCVYSLFRYLVLFVLNVLAMSLLVGVIKFVVLGGFVNILLALLVFALSLVLFAFKHALVSCWMPGIAVLNSNPFKALKQNFKCVFSKFFSIFSNYLTLVMLALAVNVMSFVFTFGVSIILTLPLTAFVFVIFQMVTYFTVNGMRFYVYPDMFITPQKYEEQDKIKKLKYLI